MRGNLLKLFVVAAGLAAIPLAALFFFDATAALANSGRNTKATALLFERIDRARASHLAKQPPDLDGYSRALRSLDASRAPRDVRIAFSNYVAAIQGTNEAAAEALLREAALRYIKKK